MRELREARGWSREKLAGEARVSLSTVVRVENEDHVPQGRKLVAIADALEVSLDDLFGRSDRMGGATGALLDSPVDQHERDPARGRRTAAVAA